MTSELLVTAHYADDADALFERARHFGDMVEATRTISSYAGLPRQPMQEGAHYTTDIRLFGVIPCNDYHIRIDALNEGDRVLETTEWNASVRSWKHRLEVRPSADGSVWIDHVVIDAGLMTPVIARYARFMYRTRHRSRNAIRIETSLSRAAQGAPGAILKTAD
jgi:hypothetical protein